MIEKRWKTLAGEVIDLRSIIESELRVNPDAQVAIASDSQQRGKHTEYVTVVTVIKPGCGGRVFFTRELIPRVRNLRERLWNEAWRSSELAMELTATPDIGEPTFQIPVHEVHIDANIDPKHQSSEYVQELVGLVTGMGFKAVVKPESWAASHAADHAVKHKEERHKPHAEGRGRSRRRAG